MKIENPDYNVTQDYLKKKLDEMSEATKFQYDTEHLTRLVSKQTYARIKAGNFKGLNLTDIKIKLSGELSLAEQ
jgi:hypothetical protein